MMQRKLFLGVCLTALVLGSCTSKPVDDDDIISATESTETTSEEGDLGDQSAEDAAESEIASDQKTTEPDQLDDLETKTDPAPKEDNDFADFDSGPKDQNAPPSAPVAPDAPMTPVTPMAENPPAENRSQPQVQSGEVEIKNIGYLANSNGGTVLIETSGPARFSKRYNSENNQFVIEVANAKLPAHLKRPYIMKEFSGSFGAINAYQTEGSNEARIVVQLKGNQGAEPIVQQEGQQILILPASASSESAVASNAPEEDVRVTEQKGRPLNAGSLDDFLLGTQKFSGAEISVQTKDAEVRDVLNFIADQSGANMIISDDVTGKISIKLRKIPWDQALVTVLRSKRLGYVRQGNVIRISSLDELKKETENARLMVESQKALEPLKIKIIPLSYADPVEMQTNILKFLTKVRGTAVVDKQSNSLVITDTEEVLERMALIIKDLDVQTPQVMIEGKVIEATGEFSRSAGINWNFSGSQMNLSPGGGFNGQPITLKPQLGITTAASDAVSAFNLALNVGTLDILGNLTAAISLAELERTAKVLSSPRVVTMNRQVAEIEQKSEDVTANSTVSNGTVTETVVRTPYVLDLKVTPQITSDGSVIMDVAVIREFLGPKVSEKSGAHAINSRKATTKILVRNGQTAVIGGVYQNDSNLQDSGVPGLKDIPVLGWLFKGRTSSTIKNELLIFLTPKILSSPKDMDAPDNRQSAAG